MKKTLGFTLIELLIVVSIIGLLASLAAFSIPYTRARARDTKRAADLDQLMKALDLYVSQNGAYPIAAAGVCLDGSDSVSLALIGDSLINTAVKEPIFPEPARCFNYATDAAGTEYSIEFHFETNAVGPAGPNTRP